MCDEDIVNDEKDDHDDQKENYDDDYIKIVLPGPVGPVHVSRYKRLEAEVKSKLQNFIAKGTWKKYKWKIHDPDLFSVGNQLPFWSIWFCSKKQHGDISLLDTKEVEVILSDHLYKHHHQYLL